MEHGAYGKVLAHIIENKGEQQRWERIDGHRRKSPFQHNGLHGPENGFPRHRTGGDIGRRVMDVAHRLGTGPQHQSGAHYRTQHNPHIAGIADDGLRLCAAKPDPPHRGQINHDDQNQAGQRNQVKHPGVILKNPADQPVHG